MSEIDRDALIRIGKMYAIDQLSTRAISESTQLSIPRINQKLHKLIAVAARTATPGTELPEGLRWYERTNLDAIVRAGRWVIMPPRRMTREQVKWAVVVLEMAQALGRASLAECPHCGRPL